MCRDVLRHPHRRIVGAHARSPECGLDAEKSHRRFPRVARIAAAASDYGLP
jgi:hypothetical protein